MEACQIWSSVHGGATVKRGLSWSCLPAARPSGRRRRREVNRTMLRAMVRPSGRRRPREVIRPMLRAMVRPSGRRRPREGGCAVGPERRHTLQMA
eukprot:6143179-Prymnesium_polylepis.1